MLADWRQNRDAAIAEFDRGGDEPPSLIANLDPMKALDGDLIHLVGDRVLAVTGPSIDAAAHDEVRAEVMGQREQFVDVALAVTDMHATVRRGKQRCGLAKVLQPAEALFLLDRDAGWVDLVLERIRALELLPRPELHRRKPERQAVGGQRERGMHEKATQRVHANLTRLVAPSVDGAGDPDGLMALALERELGRILEDQHGALTGPHTLACRCEVTRQDLRLADPFVGEEAVCGFGADPVLAGKRQADAEAAVHLSDEPVQPLLKAGIGESAVGEFL